MERVLFLSFYYEPDLCAGSFRGAALVKALRKSLPENVHIDVITTLPNRYSTYCSEAPEHEEGHGLTIHRVGLPMHKSGMLDQSKCFVRYAYKVLSLVKGTDYQLILGTSSRLMTAVLSSYVSRKKKVPLYLDVRDMFVENMRQILPRRVSFWMVPALRLLEKYSLQRASCINLVSKGFGAYFSERYPSKSFTYYTNGIDGEFVSGQRSLRPMLHEKDVLKVLYAGNIGEGQGLHHIIPLLSKELQNKIQFRIIGDGGKKQQLQNMLSGLPEVGVELLDPVSRKQLLEEYHKADILFLHLNGHEAFDYVLPSKLFEYAAVGKPIWAGVSGYSASFIKEEIDNAAVFDPLNVDQAGEVLKKLCIEYTDRSGFIEKFSREKIMNSMADDILKHYFPLSQKL